MEILDLLKQRRAEAILDLLKQQLAEAEDDVRRLRAAISEIESDDPRPPLTRRGSVGSRGRRAARTVTPDQLLKLIPTQGIARVELDMLTGAPGGRVLVTLKRLEAEGRARREGERGATRWCPVPTEPHRSPGRRASGDAADPAR
jgi:hypothetical protein